MLSFIFVMTLCFGYSRTANGISCTAQRDSCTLHVSLHVFSGRPDPTWKVNSTYPDYDRIVTLLQQHQSGQLTPNLGYSGFSVSFIISGMVDSPVIIGKASNVILEKLLLGTVPESLSGIQSMIPGISKELGRKNCAPPAVCTFRVSIHVYSGRQDPTWEVNSTFPEYDRIVTLLHQQVSGQLTSTLGYSGFTVAYDIGEMLGGNRRITIGKGSNVILEKLLLGTVPESLSNIQSMIPGIRKQLGKSCSLQVTCTLRVSIHVFSGREDPMWEIYSTYPDYVQIVTLLQQHTSGQLTPKLGYSGFTVTYVIDGMTNIDRPIIIGKESNVILEKLLLGTVPESLSNIQSTIPGIRKQLGKSCEPQAVCTDRVQAACTLRVSIHVFSGRPDPSWEVNSTYPYYGQIVTLLNQHVTGQVAPKLGYSGFTVTYVIDGMTNIDRPVIIGKGSNVILEKLLLGTVPESLSNIRAMVPALRLTQTERPESAVVMLVGSLRVISLALLVVNIAWNSVSIAV